MKRQKNKGITLIALVITIIVLLILAGVVIVTLQGNNSAPQKATEAAQKDAIAEAKDEIAMETQKDLLDYYDNKYVSKTSTGAAGEVGTQARDVVQTAAIRAIGNVQNRNSLILSTSGVENYIITINTKSFTVTGTIEENGGVTWSAITANDGGNGGGGQQAELPEDSVQALAQAGKIKRWDKINYNPGTATTASIDLPEGASIEGEKLASISLPAGASLSSSISASSAQNWVVLDVDETTGEVLIMPTTVSSQTLTLSGMNGYNNAIEALDQVAGIYKNSAYASSARSLRVEDVNKVEGHTPDGNVVDYSWNYRYGMDANLNITDAGSEIEQEYESSTTTWFYSYELLNFPSNMNCWVASRCVYTTSAWCEFRVRRIETLGGFYGTQLNSKILFMAKNYGTRTPEVYTESYQVVPVVTLKSDIQLEKNKVVIGTATATEEEDITEDMWTFK